MSVSAGWQHERRVEGLNIERMLGFGRRRIEISSSNFPRFDRNLNTGGNNYDESKGVVARNAVHHSAAHPSQLTVTIVKR